MNKTDHILDITDFVCPMTFVRTKLLLEKMAAGETAAIRLNSGEPLQNVPRSVQEHGHAVLSLELENKTETDGPYILVIQKAAAKG